MREKEISAATRAYSRHLYMHRQRTRSGTGATRGGIPMKTESRAQAVLDHIDADELMQVALDLGNIDSPTGREGPVGEYVYDWLARQGFAPKRVGLFPDRFNVIATLPGQGRGRSLVFNSHMDTTIAKEEIWT